MKVLSVCVLMVALFGTVARAQEPARPPADTARAEPPFSPADTVAAALTGKTLTPGRAFVRSLLIPGWGQFSQGARVRGTVYASLQGASAFMLVKTQIKVNDAQDDAESLREFAIDSMRADALEQQDTMLIRILANEDSAQARADSTEAVSDKLALTESRKRQREDWIALAIFFTLASGVDAYVGAHLADFPGTVSARPFRRGGVLVEWSLPFPNRQRLRVSR